MIQQLCIACVRYYVFLIVVHIKETGLQARASADYLFVERNDGIF